jgi:hypothetical protein
MESIWLFWGIYWNRYEVVGMRYEKTSFLIHTYDLIPTTYYLTFPVPPQLQSPPYLQSHEQTTLTVEHTLVFLDLIKLVQ